MWKETVQGNEVEGEEQPVLVSQGAIGCHGRANAFFKASIHGERFAKHFP